LGVIDTLFIKKSARPVMTHAPRSYLGALASQKLISQLLP
jgi:hypothetical protein